MREEEERGRRTPPKGHPSERGRGRRGRGGERGLNEPFTPSGRRPVLERKG